MNSLRLSKENTIFHSETSMPHFQAFKWSLSQTGSPESGIYNKSECPSPLCRICL